MALSRQFRCNALASVTWMIHGAVFAIAACEAASATMAATAAVGEELFTDDFSELDPSLGDPTETFGVKDHALLVRMEPGYYRRVFYDALLFEDADATVRLRLPDFAAETEGSLGLAFWGASLDEYYVLQISDSGTYSVARAQEGGWNYAVPWRSSDVIKTDPGAWNDLRVVTSGNRAIIYINGIEVARIKGKRPAIGGRFGFYCEAGKQSVVGEFSDFKVVEGPPADPNDVANDPKVLWSDDFAAFDPAWGAERGWFGVAEGHLAIKFDPNESYTTLYQGGTFEDVDATIRIRSVTGPLKEDEYATTGLVFWANDYETYYSSVITSDGWVGVNRLVNKETLFPYKTKKLPEEAKFDPQGWTTIRFITSGKHVTIEVNGVKIASIPGQPPETPWLFGVIGQSSSADSQSQFSELVFRNPAPK